jgi:hypothetical protein
MQTKPIETIEEFAQELLRNGFRVMKPTEGSKTYFFFEKHGKLGYVQAARFGGFRFSTVHKPCRHAGTGYSLGEEGTSNPTIEDAESCLVDHPSWVSNRDRLEVVKYKSLDEYQEKETVLSYEITEPQPTDADKRAHYQFYLENCVDEEKGQEALSFESWVENHFFDSWLTCKLNKIQL